MLRTYLAISTALLAIPAPIAAQDSTAARPQAELARRSGVPQSTISRIEAGDTGSISLANLERLAEALGVNAALLIVHEPEKGKGKRG